MSSFIPSAQPLLACVLLLGLLAGTSASAEVSPPEALELMLRNREVGQVQDSQAKTAFRLISSNGKVRIQEAETITRRDSKTGETSRLARFLTPSDVKGMAVLTVEQPERDDDIWLYLPALGKVRRLQGNNKREAYMGTDLSYGDVIGHEPEEWTHVLVGQEKIDGVICWIVESKPNSDSVAIASGYSKRVNWLRSDNAVMVRAELYDSAGGLLKRVTQKNIVEVAAAPERWQAMIIEVENIRTHHRTEIEISDYRANSGLAPELFSPRALERVR
ncbi:MAG: outer membrane lipoprotein-sorting protein [Parvularculaceae bacterium]